MARTECPSCESLIVVGRKLRMGNIVICPECKAELEVVWLNPIELDWPMVEDDEFDQYDEYEYTPAFPITAGLGSPWAP